jgi:hypothetical protein
MIKKMFGSTGAKVTMIAAAIIVAGVGAAYAGTLPTRVQHTVATAAQAVGVETPDPASVDEGQVGDSVDATDTVDQGQVGNVDEQVGNSTETTGNVDQGQVDDTNDATVNDGQTDNVDQGQADTPVSPGSSASHTGSSGASQSGNDGSGDSQNGNGNN